MNLDSKLIDKNIELIEHYYTTIFNKINNQRSLRKVSNKEINQILSFIILLQKNYRLQSINSNFLFEYFIFQLNYWDGLKTRFSTKIPISWFIGKKAFDRWMKRIEHDLWHSYQTARKYELSVKVDKIERDYLKINEFEEIEKKRFYNESSGLINCIETTTLYNHRSQYCVVCKFKDDCKKILKIQLPKVSILRGYEKRFTKERK